MHKSADYPPTVAGWYSAAADRPLESLSETLKEIAEVLGALVGSGRSMRYPVAPNAPDWPRADTLCRLADELVDLADRSAARPDGGNGKPERAAKRSKKDAPQHATTDAMITGALCIHHKYEEGQCGNREPATLDALRDILDKKVSKSTLSRYFKKFCRKNDRTQGYKRYQAACVGDRIGLCLKLLRGDAPLENFSTGRMRLADEKGDKWTTSSPFLNRPFHRFTQVVKRSLRFFATRHTAFCGEIVLFHCSTTR